MSERLSKFLSAPQRPEGTLGFHQVQGLLFAIACSPELVMPSEWMPLIFNGQEANYASIDEAESVTRALMDLYNAINARAMQGESDFPRDIRFRQPSLDNLEDAPLGQWSYGFVQGHDWLSGLWDHYIPEELDEELGSSVLVLSFFASRKLAEAYHQEMSQARPTTLEAFADKMLGLIEDAMNSYAHLAYSIRTALAEHSQSGQPYVGEKKVGRNDPCPCGSGRKYKKCCLQ